jgi:hypothetical protein
LPTGLTLIELTASRGGRLHEEAAMVDVIIPLARLLSELHRRGVVHRQVQ